MLGATRLIRYSVLALALLGALPPLRAQVSGSDTKVERRFSVDVPGEIREHRLHEPDRILGRTPHPTGVVIPRGVTWYFQMTGSATPEQLALVAKELERLPGGGIVYNTLFASFTDEHVMPFVSCEGLRVFGPRGSFPGTTVRSKILTRFLAAQKDLRILKLGTLIPHSLAEALAPLRKLEVLDLNRSRLEDQDFWGVTFPSSLRFVDLSMTGIRSRSLEFALRATALTDLRIAGCLIDDGDLEDLPLSPQLMFLDLSGTGISEKGLHELPLRAHLRGLRLSCLDVDLAELPVFPRLKALEVEGHIGIWEEITGVPSRTHKPSDAGILRVFEACPSLEALRIRDGLLTDKILSPEVWPKGIRSLDIRWSSGIGATALSRFAARNPRVRLNQGGAFDGIYLETH